MDTSNTASPKIIYLIHHSHTDIGYTALQHQVERWHVDFIRQALDIITEDSISETNDGGFKWTCESFWAVEKFLERASPGEKDRFIEAVQAGTIGISGNYLNFNELIDFAVLGAMLGRARAFGATIGVPIESAMTADINGYSWGYAQALHDNGMQNLFTCIHTHHGRFPLGKRHLPFWWETPQGNRILVWNGEHYHFGNELGLVPGAVSSYIIKDECDAEMIFTDHWAVAEIRIPRLFAQLARDGYPFDFVPLMASGLRTDNAPPSAHILTCIRRWNQTHGENIQVRMATLDEFFDILRTTGHDFPVYRGDWPDWWSDGPASYPDYTKIFRETQRTLWYYRQLHMRYPGLPRTGIDRLEYNLALYAEHTFSHADSMSQPWRPLVHTITARKKTYAAAAHEAARGLVDEAFEQLGATTLRTDMPLRYRAINPLQREISGIIRLPIQHFEYHELKLDKGAEVHRRGTDKQVPYQTEPIPGGIAYCIYVTLAPGEECEFEIVPVQDNDKPISTITGLNTVQTPHVMINWREPEGIISWIDRTTNCDLLRLDRQHAPFTPVYDKTPAPEPEQICAVRGQMDLNRKGPDVQRSAGRLLRSTPVETGEIFSRVELEYAVPGMSLYKVELTAYLAEPRVDVAIRMNKDQSWEPENVYVALPFQAGNESFQLWLDKTGAMVRPRIDQLPGTLIDFYSIQEGLALIGERHGVAIAAPDTNLIQIGPLDYGERTLHDPANSTPDPAHLYAWLMTNYWETNFGAGLAGFYEFRFTVIWGRALINHQTALQRCRDINCGIQCFRRGD